MFNENHHDFFHLSISFLGFWFLVFGFLGFFFCMSLNLFFILKTFLNAWFENVSSNEAVSLYFFN